MVSFHFKHYTFMISFRQEFTISLALRFLPLIYVLLFLLLTQYSIWDSPYLMLTFIIGLFCISLHTGFEFDQQNNRYRNYRSIAGITIGTWQELPQYDYFLVSRSAMNYSAGSRIQTYTVSSSSCFLYGCIKSNIATQKDPKYLLTQRTEKGKCISIAKKLNEIYAIKIYDATGRETITLN